MEPPSETEKQMLSPDQRRLLASLSSLHRDLPSGLWSLRGQEDGVPCDRLYVPHALRHWVLEAARQFLDHTGINSTSHFYRKGVFMFRLVPEVHSGSATLPLLPGEEPEGTDTEGCPPPELPSCHPFPGLEYGCDRSRVRQFRRSPVPA